MQRFSRRRELHYDHKEMLKLMMLAALTLTLSGCSASSFIRTESGTSNPEEASLAGSWVGAATHRGAQLATTVRFFQNAQGISATISTPDAYQLDAPLRNVRYDHPNLHFEVEEAGERLIFEGKRDGELITGTVRGGELQAEFTLKRAGTEQAVNYAREEVRFHHDNIKLSGTLLLPSHSGKHPAVIFIHGTGPHTRDDYRFYADRFARHGIAALIYDKRPVEGRGSNDEQSDLRDLAGDVLAAVEFLKSRNDINRKQIGLWGLSQGGWVAPLAAMQSADVAFLIVVSAPGVKVGEVHLYAGQMRLRERGFSEAEISEAIATLKQVDEFVRTGGDRTALQSVLDQAWTKPWAASTILPRTVPTAAQQSRLLRWRNLDFDPAPGWARIKVPVLAFFGDRDNVVPVQESVERIDRALKQARNADVTIKVYPDADHIIKLRFGERPDTGGKWDWARPVPGYIELMINWTLERVDVVQ
jgi:dienelactone hydrolase